MVKHFILLIIHRRKKLFCKVTHICNLVQEFNGLVSKRVNRRIGPFYFYKLLKFPYQDLPGLFVQNFFSPIKDSLLIFFPG